MVAEFLLDKTEVSHVQICRGWSRPHKVDDLNATNEENA